MTYKLIVSREAHRDIDEIVTYIAHELKNAQAAVNFLGDVENSYCHILKNPFMYSLCKDERLYGKGYRKVIIKRYLVLYRVDEAKKSVYVIRVVYGPRDYAKLL